MENGMNLSKNDHKNKSNRNNMQEDQFDNLEESIKLYKARWKNQYHMIDTKIFNRRKKKLDELLSGHDPYFSEESIKEREPILYEIYVGSHKRKKNQLFNQSLQNGSSTTMTKFLMDELEEDLHGENINKELNKECREFGYKVNELREIYQEVDQINKQSTNLLEDEIDELVRLMSLRFLMGGDKDYFDYKEVDENELYDDLDQINRDEEEAYFDQEEEEFVKMENNNSNLNDKIKYEYTGVIDY